MKPVKNLHWVLVVLMLLPQMMFADQLATSQNAANAENLPLPTPYAVTVQDGNSRVWERTTYELDPAGNVIPQTHSYTELATGLNHLVNGQWVESSEQIDILPNGTAVATNGQHQAYFPGDIYQGQIELVTPDGVQLHSRPLGLSYFDGTNSVLIAELTNSIGQVLGTNQVIYTNAFTDFAADLVYTYRKGGFEQDIVLREQPPAPATFGLDPNNTRLQVLTEFFDTSDPAETTLAVNPQDGLADKALTFGASKMIRGKAFLIGDSTQAMPVYKSWQHLDGRTFLVEELPLASIAAELEQLPASATSQSALHKVSPTRLLPPARLVATSTNTVQFAKADLKPQAGVVLDYVMLGSTVGNFTFQSDTTYLMSGSSYFEIDGTATFEGGTVIKFTPTTSGFILYYGSVLCQTGPYRPAIFTAQDDNTVGETISGSTGTPSGYYGNGITIENGTSTILHDLRMSYLNDGFVMYVNSAEFDNIQAINCATPIIHAFCSATINNGLFANIGTVAVQSSGSGPITVTGTHLTIDDCITFADSNTPQLALTNCLITATTNLLAGTGTLVTNHVTILASDAGIFQSVGGGGHYLASGSPYRGVGTTNITPSLLAGLPARTTYPPLVYSNLTFSLATNLPLHALRDTNAAPDLGYHYDPLDYITDGLTVTNAALTLTNGVAVACYNEPGILLQGGSSIISIGTPLLPNWFVRYRSVQEQPVFLDGTNVFSGQNISASAVGSTSPSGIFQFTHFAAPADGGWHFNDTGTSAFSSLTLEHSELWGGTNNLSGVANAAALLQNNLFFRSAISASNSVASAGLALTNNLIYGASLSLIGPTNGAWDFFNNDVDSSVLATNSIITDGYNAFINCSAGFTGTSNIISTNAIGYQAGPLGNFYQPTNSLLINVGSTTADHVGLYYFTTQTNQAIESNSVVDIGYHYVAVDTNGNPLANSNGIPYYLLGGSSNQMVPPSITLTNPANNSIFAVGTNILLGASASDVDATITQVQFFQGSNSLGVITNSPYNLIWSNAPAGIYSLMAVATDSDGLVATSSIVNITFTSLLNSNTLILWLKADSITGLVNNASVGTWSDQSGNGNNGIQPTGANQPLWVANALNGLPVVQFNGTNSYLNLPYFLYGTTGAEAVVVLRAATNTPSVQQALWRWGSSGDPGPAYPNTSGQIVDNFGSSSIYTIGVPAQPLNQYHVYEVSGYNGNWLAWINGQLQAENFGNTYGVWNPSSESYALGLDTYRTTYFAGDVAEVLVFNRPLTTAERQALNSYVNGKYALVPLVPATPTNLVAQAISTNQISLTWNEALTNGGATQISVERSLSSNGVYTAIAQVSDTLSYVDTNLTAETTYYYEVQAINLTQWSPPSNVAQATTTTNGTSLPFGALMLWLKADSGLTQIGTNTAVNLWADQSGNGNNGIQPTGANQPLWVANALNGLPVVQFNGTNSYLNLPYFLYGTTGAEAVVVLRAATNTPSVQQALWHWGAYDSGSPMAYPNTSGQIVDNFGSANAAYNIGVPAQPLNQYHVYEVSSYNGNWLAWINGQLQAENFGNTYGVWNPGPFNSYALGLDSDRTTYFAGDVAEVLVFNRPLTTAERQALNSYVNGKYALVPLVPATPTNLVAQAVSPTQIGLTWNEVLNQGATLVSVERKTGSGGTYAPVAQLGEATSYLDTNLTAGTTYYYRVRAINLSSWSAYSNETNATTLVTGSDVPLGNLLLWLKADSGLTQIGTNTAVNLWADQSGNGNNGIQPTGANQPLWVANALNGLPVVQFNGTNSYLNLPYFLYGTTGAEAVVVLRAATNTPSVQQALWRWGSSGDPGPAYPNTSGQIVDNFGSSSIYTIGVPAQPLNQYHVYEVSGYNGNWLAWINGQLQAENFGNTYGVWNPSSESYALGLDTYRTTYFAGDVAEVLVFNRPLTTAERQALNSYVNGKYALVPLVPATPTNLVAQAISTNQISLTWNEALTNGGATQISVERSLSSNGVYTAIAQVSDTLSYVDTNLTAETTYYYEVQAINLTQWSPPSNVAQATTTTNGTSLPFGALMLWLKADSGLTQIGTNTAVNLWADQSGNGNNGIQPTGANQPLWVANALNGLPVVQFNGTNSYLNLPYFLYGTTGAEAVVVLRAATNTPSVQQALWHWGAYDSGSPMAYPNTSGQIVDNFGSANAAYNIGVPAQPLNQYHVYEVSSYNGNWLAWINGQLQAENFGNTYGVWNPGPFNSYALGLDSDRTTYFAGDVAEVLVFNRPLAGDERVAVGSYLISKYGLSRYATNASLPSTPTNLIAMGLSPYELNLQWKQTSTNATAFGIQRKTGSGGTYVEIGSVSGATNYLDTTVYPTNQYYYRLTAKNYFGQSGYSTEISPPVATLTLISTNTYLITGATNLLVAQATDVYSTINQVQIVPSLDVYNLIGSGTSVPYTNKWASIFSTTYAFNAIVKDALGNSRYSPSLSITTYLDSNGDGIPNFLQVSQGNNPLNPWTTPGLNTNDHTAPIITLLIPTNAVIVP